MEVRVGVRVTPAPRARPGEYCAGRMHSHLVARQLRVVLQRAEHAHQVVVAEERLVDRRVVQHHQPLEDGEHEVQVLARLEVLRRLEESHQLRNVLALQQHLPD